MAIYRPPKPRWRLALLCALAGLAVGLVLGLVLAADDQDPTDAAHAIRAELVAAAGSLEVAAIEYEESVVDGDVVAEAEYEGAVGALASSRERFDEVRPALVSLLPAHVDPIDALYEEIEQSMTARVDAAEVTDSIEQLIALLEGETS